MEGWTGVGLPLDSAGGEGGGSGAQSVGDFVPAPPGAGKRPSEDGRYVTALQNAARSAGSLEFTLQSRALNYVCFATRTFAFHWIVMLAGPGFS